jgi:hypothetical protein
MRSAFVTAVLILVSACSSSTAGGDPAGAGTGPSGTSSGGSGGNGTGATSSGGATGGAPANGPTGPAALAKTLGFPATNGKQTFGWGYDGGQDPFTGQYALGAPIQILDVYMVGMNDNGGWPTWNTDADGAGAYVNVIFDKAKAHGAVPMYTLYQMITSGLGNGGVDCFNDATCMTTYWSDFRSMLQRIGSYGSPAMLNVEPDLTGYAQLMNSNPASIPVRTSTASECNGLPANLIGYASCILRLRDQYAPKLLVGFNVSDWLGQDQAITFLRTMGVGNGDFLVVQTLDRDVGCFEIQDSAGECNNGRTANYWGDSDWTSYVASMKRYHQAYQLPLVWWQTPMGVPADSPGRNPNASAGYRDNRSAYFFGNVTDLVDAGGLAAVFGQGQGQQADISTDVLPGGAHQYKTNLGKYVAAPVPLN